MLRRLTLVLCVSLLLPPAFAMAQADVSADPARTTVEGRLKALEERQAEIYHTLAEKKEAGVAANITERISISGLLEVEAAAESLDFENGTSDSASDLTLATAWVSLGLDFNKHFTADLSFLYEEGATDLEVDEAAINFASGPWYARIGQQYLPFGVYNSHFISDPLTLELGETRETAAVGGYGNELFSFSAFVFNGNADEVTDEDHISDFGASLVVTPISGVSLGGSYLSDLADSDAELISEWNRRVAGWSAFAIWEVNAIQLSGEILGATRSFDQPGSPVDGRQPLAWNLEAAYDLRDNLEVAVRLEGSDELPEAPERQYGVDVSWSPLEGTSLSLEYLRGEFDEQFADGKDRDLITAQLGIEF